jgi:tRNA uridine 5-carbamoylmethylation protein Kti12
MNELNVSDLEKKIKQVEEDLKRFVSDGGTTRQIDVMTEYKDYLLDQLKELKNDLRKSN